LQLPEEPKDLLFGNSDQAASSASMNTNELIEQEHYKYSLEVEKVYFNMKYQDSYKIWKL
jgi:hypothetical protein